MSLQAKLRETRVAVVIPCYQVEAHIRDVIWEIPPWVSLIVCVNDASKDGTAAAIRSAADPRVVLLEHVVNRGVGGAMITGYEECLRRDVAIIVKMDGDGQMDAGYLLRLIAPLLRNEADFTKGNRWRHSASLRSMPWLRRLGNLGLSFLTKMVTGYWKQFDPCNGYTAIRASVLRDIPLDRLARDYFFETSMLVELNILRAVVHDVPIPARYGDEKSSLNIRRILLNFPPRLARSFVRRVWRRYFIDDFGAASLLMLAGAAMTLFGAIFGGLSWHRSYVNDVPATTGTVMLAAMPALMGFQLLLQAMLYDINDSPTQLRSDLGLEPRTEVRFESERKAA